MTALQMPPVPVNVRDPGHHQRRCILVVDDEPMIRDLLAGALREEGYEVVEAADGVEALDVLAREACDLVLLDGHLPRMSGRAVLETLRRDPRTATLPVILVTADDAVADRVSGLSSGADDYVTKPFSTREVVARVNANLRAHDAWSATLAMHDRHRATLSKAFAGAARQPTLEGAGAVLCNAIGDQAGVAAVTLVRCTADERAVAIASAGSPAVEIGRHLIDKARHGPWLDQDPLVACAPLDPYDEAPLPGMLLVELDGRSVAASAALAGAIDCAAAISGLLRAPLLARHHHERNGSALREVLARRAFRPFFQPIVDLRSGETLGVEALTRFDDGSSPDERFVEASAVGLGRELELATLSAAVVAARSLAPATAWLSLNVSPELMLSSDHDAVRDILDLRDRDLVLELSERELVTDYDAVRASLRAAGDGVRWSIDDAGSGFASLRHILKLEPAFIKLDRTWVAGVDDDPARQAMIAGLGHFAQRTGAQLIAEGIERDEEHHALVELGVALGQGFLLGRPVPISA